MALSTVTRTVALKEVDFSSVFNQLHGKELSYNNLLDVDAATNLMQEFLYDGPTFAIMKHNNACGLATRDSIIEAYNDAAEDDKPAIAASGTALTLTDGYIDVPQAIKKVRHDILWAGDISSKAPTRAYGRHTIIQ